MKTLGEVAHFVELTLQFNIFSLIPFALQLEAQTEIYLTKVYGIIQKSCLLAKNTHSPKLSFPAHSVLQEAIGFAKDETEGLTRAQLDAHFDGCNSLFIRVKGQLTTSSFPSDE